MVPYWVPYLGSFLGTSFRLVIGFPYHIICVCRLGDWKGFQSCLIKIVRTIKHSVLLKTSYILRVSSMHFKILLCAKASDIKRSLIQVPHSTRTDNGGKFEYHEISVHHYQNRETILSLCSGCCIYRGNTFSFFCFVGIPGSQRHLVDLLFRIKQKGYLPLWQVLNKHLSHFLLSTVFSKPQITKVGENW